MSGPTLASLTLALDEAIGGESLAGTATLSGAAPSAGVVVTLESDTAAATVPASITIASGATSGTFTVVTAAVDADTRVTITGAAGGTARAVTLDLGPVTAAGAVASFTTRADDIAHSGGAGGGGGGLFGGGSGEVSDPAGGSQGGGGGGGAGSSSTTVSGSRTGNGRIVITWG